MFGGPSRTRAMTLTPHKACPGLGNHQRLEQWNGRMIPRRLNHLTRRCSL